MRKRPETSIDLQRTLSVCGAVRLATTALVALLTLVGCPLDERTLQPMPSTNGGGGSAGADGGDDGGAGGGTSPVDGASGTTAQAATSGGGFAASATNSVGGTSTALGGAGGTTSTSTSTTTGEAGAGNDPGCPDLDDNSVADCEETLVQNASFDVNLNGWHEESNALGSWEHEDALDHDASGSATITNRTFYEDREGQVMRGLWQCVPASAATSYRLLTQVRISGEAGQVWGGLSVSFYDAPDCTGNVVTASTPMLGTTTDWSMTEARAEAATNTQSMLVRLVVNKPYSAPAVTVDFDNVLIREE